MAKLVFTVWETAGSTADGDVLQEESVNIEANAVQSVPLPPAANKFRKVRFFCDADAYVVWGPSPQVASPTNGRPIGAENPEYWSVQSGYVISVIERTS